MNNCEFQNASMNNFRGATHHSLLTTHFLIPSAATIYQPVDYFLLHTANI